MKSVFISHAVADKPLVDEIVDLLESGIGVPQNDIFCVSQPGNIPSGVDYKQHIKDALDNAKLVMVIITPNFYNSAFSLCELGGVWLRAKSFIPLLVPPFDFTDLKAVLEGVQALKADDATKLDTLRDEVLQRLNLQTHATTPRWNSRRDKFLSGLNSTLANLPNNLPVPKSEHEKVVKKLKEYEEEYSKQETEIEKLNSIIEKLKNAKDANQVANVFSEHSEKPEQFQQLIDTAKAILHKLPSAAQETLYHHFRQKKYQPEDKRNAEDAVEVGFIKESPDEDGFVPSDRNPIIRTAIQAVSSLNEWLMKNAEEGSDFELWYSENHDGGEPNITLKPFWNEHLLYKSI